MSVSPMVRSAATNTRVDAYVAALLTKDFAGISSVLTNTSALLTNSLAQLTALSQAVQQNASDAKTASSSASQSAQEAGVSQTAAKTSETNANASAQSAQQYEAQCAQIKTDVAAAQTIVTSMLHSFAAVWLGELDADPTESQYGDQLVLGAEYYNKTTQHVRLYTDKGWVDQDAAAESALYSSQLILTQCQQLAAQCQAAAAGIPNQVNNSVFNNYGLATGKYGIYAALWDTTFQDAAKIGALSVCYRDASSNDVWHNIAAQDDLTSEATTRASADTALDAKKANLSGGNTFSGKQTIGGTLIAGVQGGDSTTNSKILFGTGSYISFQNDDNYVQYDSSGVVMTISRSGGISFLGNRVALASDVTTEATSRASADTALDNKKVNRAGDTMTGALTVGGTITGSAGSVISLDTKTNSSANMTLNGDGNLIFILQNTSTSTTKSWMSLWSDGTLHTTYGDVAFSKDLSSEATTRASADTALDNKKSNLSGGNTFTGDQTINGGVTTTGNVSTSAAMVASDFAAMGSGNYRFDLFCGSSNAGLSINNKSDDSQASLFTFGLDGSITTSKGAVAFSSDVSSEATTRASEDTWLQNQINNRVQKTGDTMTGGLTLTGNIGGVTAQWDGSNPATGAYVNYPGFYSVAQGRGGQAVFQVQEHVGSSISGLISIGYNNTWRYLGIPQTGHGRINDSDYGDLAYLSDFTSSDTRILRLPGGQKIQHFVATGSGSTSYWLTYPEAFSGDPTVVAFVNNQSGNSRFASLNLNTLPSASGFQVDMTLVGNSAGGSNAAYTLHVIAIGPA